MFVCGAQQQKHVSITPNKPQNTPSTISVGTISSHESSKSQNSLGILIQIFLHGSTPLKFCLFVI